MIMFLNCKQLKKFNNQENLPWEVNWGVQMFLLLKKNRNQGILIEVNLNLIDIRERILFRVIVLNNYFKNKLEQIHLIEVSM